MPDQRTRTPTPILLHRRTALTVAALCGLGLELGLVSAARALPVSYPTRPVRLVIPYTPGGATDVIGRIVGQKLGVVMGQPVVIENRAGAAGNLGAAAVSKDNPDGYSLLLGALTSHAINSVLMGAAAGFDLDKSFAPVSILGRVPLLVVVGPSVKAANLAEFIELARTKPGGLNYGSSGNGSPQHLAAELFKRQAGVDLVHVPYKGSSPALNDLMAGQVDVIFDTLPAAQPFIKAGRLRALGIATPQRNPALPDVPTVSEAGVKGFEVTSMFGLLAPAATPAPIIERIHSALQDVMAMPEVRDTLLNQGVTPALTSAQDARTAIRDEVGKWTRVIRDSNIKPE